MLRAINTFGYVGLLRPAPGTWGSLVAVLIGWAIEHWLGFLPLVAATLAVTALGFWSVGAPTSSILNLATTQSIHMIALSPEEMTAAIGANPIFARTTLPGGVYAGVDEAVPVVGVPNVLVVSAEMDDDLAYAITKAMFDNIAELQAVHPAANQTTVEFTLDATPVPLHPGAIRYFEEIGATIPDRLRP